MLADELQRDSLRVSHDQSQAHIFRLSLEIRLHIWELVLRECEDHVGKVSRENHEEYLFKSFKKAIIKDGEELNNAEEIRHAPNRMFGSYVEEYAYTSIALLLICRRIYLET